MKIDPATPSYKSVPPKLNNGKEHVVSYLAGELLKQGQNITLFSCGDSITSVKLIPAVYQMLRLNQFAVTEIIMNKYIDRPSLAAG